MQSYKNNLRLRLRPPDVDIGRHRPKLILATQPLGHSATRLHRHVSFLDKPFSGNYLTFFVSIFRPIKNPKLSPKKPPLRPSPKPLRLKLPNQKLPKLLMNQQLKKQLLKSQLPKSQQLKQKQQNKYLQVIWI